MNRFQKYIGVAALVALSLILKIGFAHAELRVDITRGVVKPIPVAVTSLLGSSTKEQNIGRNIARVIKADLVRSGLFSAIDNKAFIDVENSLDTVPKFGNWRVLKAQALSQGAVQIESGNRLKVQFRLWDVFAEQQMVGRVYSTVPENWRRIAHIIADSIYKRVTGENGYFDTRVVYIAETGRADRRIKRLAIMDQDGENHHFLTDGSSLVLTPRFSPSRQEITYMSYHGNVPRVYIFNIDSGRQELLGDFPGMTFAPRFSPDGNKVIMSMAKDGNTEIYTMDLRTRAVKRLTKHSAIDTSPHYSPDGKRIVFNSDRSGTQQIYVMGANGGRAKRISFGRGRYATPVWSPRGDLIAFTKITGGKFFIGVMDTDGKGERLLAEGFLVESPTWAPNGRVIMYFRETPISKKGGVVSKLFSIDLTGHNEREMVTPMDASDPAWSPLIP
ncbi:MAG: Tol-Pal system protein TolB [Rhodospirillaceae bacterium]|nr:Tol-Pal system protein TolB [Rhodospirillaceae bacterium]MBT4939441.1 Tol-Pal system protein TolB [Rhodospirillaceae bacterium]MBT5941645.1 Tol-Pal system protein TolB [Rhodospirillaceae bacterium]MBT7266215.1 Tol-Pal system protein TolB [Rhodospirillaceae bacterium]